MVKSELLSAMVNKFPNHPERDIELALHCILEQMAEALESGDRIEIRDFGSFDLRHRPARLARNPKTGESVQLPVKTVVHFKPGKQMRERVDASREQYKIKNL